jgi:murein L,D-transpeptidase YcbB/YkuD
MAFIMIVITPSCRVFKKQKIGLKVAERELQAKIQKVKPPDSIIITNHLNEYDNKHYWNAETKEFYSRRNNLQAWETGKYLSDNEMDLIQAIDYAEHEGLMTKEYNYSEILNTLNNIRNAENTEELTNLTARLDILMTNAYLTYACDLLCGKINPQNLESIWDIHPKRKNLPEYLEKALSNHSILSSLDALKPDTEQYALLKDKLKKYRKKQENSGWPKVGFFDMKEQGDTSVHLINVKHYLYETGFLEKNDSSPYFDRKLATAVANFQQQHGINPDSVIGPNTLKEMNKTIAERIGQIIINLERLRWAPDAREKEYITVNLPGFTLRYYQNNTLTLQMKAIVGKLENRTPLLIDTIEYIVFSPVWNVPRSISVKEFLPKIKANPNYLFNHNFVLLNGYGTNTDTLNPNEIKWDSVTKKNFGYRIIQKPGPDNALGLVKFIFPNKYSIYMHDTPADHLFDEIERDFSHGCIRLEKPFELAEALLNDSGQHPMDSIMAYIRKDKPKTILLNDIIPVYIQYYTAFVDKQGSMHFLQDIYGYDIKQLARLRELNGYDTDSL